MRKHFVRVAVAAAVLSGATALTPQPAGADHSHFIYQPANGNHPATCRYIAAGQTSKTAEQPGGHAFHAHVHTGTPGSDDHGTDFDKETNAADYDCVWVNSP